MALDVIDSLRHIIARLGSLLERRRHPRRLLLRVERLREGTLDWRRMADRQTRATIAPQDWERMNERQIAVARQFVLGKTYKEISVELGINVAAVQNAMKAIRGFTGITSRTILAKAIADYLELHPGPEAPPDDRLWVVDLLYYAHCAHSDGVDVLRLEHGVV